MRMESRDSTDLRYTAAGENVGVGWIETREGGEDGKVWERGGLGKKIKSQTMLRRASRVRVRGVASYSRDVGAMRGGHSMRAPETRDGILRARWHVVVIPLVNL